LGIKPEEKKKRLFW